MLILPSELKELLNSNNSNTHYNVTYICYDSKEIVGNPSEISRKYLVRECEAKNSLIVKNDSCFGSLRYNMKGNENNNKILYNISLHPDFVRNKQLYIKWIKLLVEQNLLPKYCKIEDLNNGLINLNRRNTSVYTAYQNNKVYAYLTLVRYAIESPGVAVIALDLYEKGIDFYIALHLSSIYSTLRDLHSVYYTYYGCNRTAITEISPININLPSLFCMFMQNKKHFSFKQYRTASSKFSSIHQVVKGGLESETLPFKIGMTKEYQDIFKQYKFNYRLLKRKTTKLMKGLNSANI